MNKKSFIRELLIYLSSLAGLLMIVLGIFFISSYQTLEKEIKDSSEAFLGIYRSEFNNSISELDSLLKDIVLQREALAELKSGIENERTFAAISLHNYILELVAMNTSVDVIVIYEEEKDICLDAVSSAIKYKEKNEIREYTKTALGDQSIQNGTWDFAEIDHTIYLYKAIKFNGRIIALYTRMDRLLTVLDYKPNENKTIMLVNTEGKVGRVWGKESKIIYEGINLSQINHKNFYIMKKQVNADNLSMYCYTDKGEILKQTHVSMIVVAVIAYICIGFILFIISYTKKNIIIPMKSMVSDMECIRQGEYDIRINNEFATKEFDMLQSVTNQMVEEIVGLKIQTYEKKIELQEMELKSIRLQLKPHFFLNALTTISSLSGQGKNAQIKTYIDALSKNIRYMFRAGFHTVSIKEEIKHVENYFEMQELKYPNCVFYLIDLPIELEEWKIPQMLIHTFIENEYKYAVSMGAILTVLIKVSKTIYQSEEMLLIEIEDDGVGYPEEVLEYMNNKENIMNDSGNRIGLIGIKKMMNLMYEREDLVQLSNLTPHGCFNRIYVPKCIKHELQEETIQNRI